MLRGKGVEVFYGENLTIEDFNTLEEKFRDALQKGDIGIVFFAGHAYTYNSATQLMTVTEGKPRIEDHAVNVLQLNIRLAHRGPTCARARTAHVVNITITQDEKARNQGQPFPS